MQMVLNMINMSSSKFSGISIVCMPINSGRGHDKVFLRLFMWALHDNRTFISNQYVLNNDLPLFTSFGFIQC